MWCHFSRRTVEPNTPERSQRLQAPVPPLNRPLAILSDPLPPAMLESSLSSGSRHLPPPVPPVPPVHPHPPHPPSPPTTLPTADGPPSLSIVAGRVQQYIITERREAEPRLHCTAVSNQIKHTLRPRPQQQWPCFCFFTLAAVAKLVPDQ